jgi:hypothetical protein
MALQLATALAERQRQGLAAGGVIIVAIFVLMVVLRRRRSGTSGAEKRRAVLPVAPENNLRMQTNPLYEGGMLPGVRAMTNAGLRTALMPRGLCLT